jgi:hypothetical protein
MVLTSDPVTRPSCINRQVGEFIYVRLAEELHGPDYIGTLHDLSSRVNMCNDHLAVLLTLAPGWVNCDGNKKELVHRG